MYIAIFIFRKVIQNCLQITPNRYSHRFPLKDSLWKTPGTCFGDPGLLAAPGCLRRLVVYKLAQSICV